MAGSLNKFTDYKGEWYTYKEDNDIFNIEIKEPDYTVNFKISLDHLCENMVYFRIEDYKEYYFGNKRIGPKDCDLTVLLGNGNVYQFEVKDMRPRDKSFDSANNQIDVSDDLLKSILWFIDPEDMCGLKNFNSVHIVIHLRKRESLDHGIVFIPKDNYIIVRLSMSRMQKKVGYNLRNIIEGVEQRKYLIG